MTKPGFLLRLSVLFLASAASLASTGGGGPPTDNCSDPPSAVLDTLQLGAGTFNESDAFVALGDGDVIPLDSGGQGGRMIGVRLRLTGSAAPSCLAQRSLASEQQTTLATDERPVRTYDDGAGGRITQTIWMVLEVASPAPGTSITITAEAGGVTATRQLFLRAGTPDAAPLQDADTTDAP